MTEVPKIASGVATKVASNVSGETVSQSETRLSSQSRASRVTLFEDRAEVIRRITVPLSNTVDGYDLVELRIDGDLSVFLDDRSVRVTALHPDVRVVNAVVGRTLDWIDEAGPDSEAQLERELAQAEREANRLEHIRFRATAKSERMTTLMQDWGKALGEAPPGLDSETVESWRNAWQTLTEADDSLIHRRLDLGIERRRVLDQIDQAAARFNHRVIKPVMSSHVDVQLEVGPVESETDENAAAYDPPTEITLELKYRTPCALWRPEHLVSAAKDEDGQIRGQLEIVTWATVWQRTGEDWTDVEMAFSTARPARAAMAPLVTEDRLDARKKTSDERKIVRVEVRDETIQVVDTGGAGRKKTAEMPGVDDGGKPLELTADSLVTIPSTGEPYRVQVSRRVLAAEVDRILVPELSLVAFYRARTELTGDIPLLAGPCRIARGDELVGRSKVDFVAVGAGFEIGLGADDGLRVKREAHEKGRRKQLTGTQIIERRVELFVSNISGSAKSVEITERIPVSELEQVDIELGKARGWELDAEDGFLRFNLELPPGGTKTLEFEYELRAKSSVVLSAAV